ncbi:hypothetical protein [Metabacillus arenae]|uniref:Uncharacterized protein n=1 Tax=Metabacillus arenae TaxID=2771434 RepID=A0A926RZW5_9BACI|nr:hypothetical protein [Metabacillus arenae]MBD1383581.1 hypothetical protein [Metabacillus arenae]
MGFLIIGLIIVIVVSLFTIDGKAKKITEQNEEIINILKKINESKK